MENTKPKKPKLRITYPDGKTYDFTAQKTRINLGNIYDIPCCEVIRWGSFRLNFWFNCSSGYGWKTAVSYAKKRLEHLAMGYSSIEIIYD